MTLSSGVTIEGKVQVQATNFFSSIIVIMSRDREEEYFEPGNLQSEDVKKFKKEEDDKSYEYFVAKVRFVA